MENFFEVSNHEEAEVFAFEELKAEIQLEIQKCLVDSGVTRRDLAKRMDCSAAWVTQALSDEANLTLESVSKIFLALGRRCVMSSAPLDFHIEGYEDSDAIVNDVGRRDPGPEDWHMERNRSRTVAAQPKKYGNDVICLRSYVEQTKRQSFRFARADTSERSEMKSVELAYAHELIGK